MNESLRKKLIDIARDKISCEDVSHDFEHTYRVLLNAEKITKFEGGDLDIIIPAALFHDLVVYPKNNKKRFQSQEVSAIGAEKILKSLNEYPQEKIVFVKTAIIECSFTKGIIPERLESKILQDADKLESTGVISIMRTFSSTGQMKRPFYNTNDPFCKSRKPNNIDNALDLFYSRLLLVKDKMNTKTGKKISKQRHKALIFFLNELKKELE